MAVRRERERDSIAPVLQSESPRAELLKFHIALHDPISKLTTINILP